MDIWLKRIDKDRKSANMTDLSELRSGDGLNVQNGTCHSVAATNGNSDLNSHFSTVPTSNSDLPSQSAPVSLYVDVEAYTNYDSNTMSLPEQVRQKLAELELEFAEGKMS